MKPHPTPHRIRKTIKWGGAVVTVVLVVVWVWSATHVVINQYTPSDSLTFIAGGIAHSHTNWPPGTKFATIPLGWRVDRTPFQVMWQPVSMNEIPTWKGWTVAFWPVVVIAGAIAAWAWRLDAVGRRRCFNLCPKCNYDRTGLAADVLCPECGAASVSV